MSNFQTTKEIAAALGLSPYTIEDYVSSACGKVGARGRRELVAKIFLDLTFGRLSRPGH